MTPNAPTVEQRITVVDVILLAIPLTALLVYFVTGPIMKFWEARRFDEAQCKGKILVVAAQEYAHEHHGDLPTADHWEEELHPYLTADVAADTSKFVRVSSPYWEKPRRFAFNRALSGKRLDAYDWHAVVFYESSLTSNDASDNLKSPAPTDTTGIVVTHGDGWAEWVGPDRVAGVMTESHRAEAAGRGM